MHEKLVKLIRQNILPSKFELERAKKVVNAFLAGRQDVFASHSNIQRLAPVSSVATSIQELVGLHRQAEDGEPRVPAAGEGHGGQIASDFDEGDQNYVAIFSTALGRLLQSSDLEAASPRAPSGLTCSSLAGSPPLAIPTQPATSPAFADDKRLPRNDTRPASPRASSDASHRLPKAQTQGIRARLGHILHKINYMPHSKVNGGLLIAAAILLLVGGDTWADASSTITDFEERLGLIRGYIDEKHGEMNDEDLLEIANDLTNGMPSRDRMQIRRYFSLKEELESARSRRSRGRWMTGLGAVIGGAGAYKHYRESKVDVA
jgi:hypothetical protein